MVTTDRMDPPQLEAMRRALEHAYRPGQSGAGRFWAMFGDIIRALAWWSNGPDQSLEVLRPATALAIGLMITVVCGIVLALIGLDIEFAFLFSTLGLGVLCLIGTEISGRAHHRAERTRECYCRSCEYPLDGLESMGSIESAGELLEIGPRWCPECGREWPRILPA